jgi:predicted RNA binding protein YcfA (HicA-like mRNA interferase family)
MPRLPTVKPRQVIRALGRAGFEMDHQTGSHIVLWRASDSCRVVVPRHNRSLYGNSTTPNSISPASSGTERNSDLTLAQPLLGSCRLDSSTWPFRVPGDHAALF